MHKQGNPLTSRESKNKQNVYSSSEKIFFNSFSLTLKGDCCD